MNKSCKVVAKQEDAKNRLSTSIFVRFYSIAIWIWSLRGGGEVPLRPLSKKVRNRTLKSP